MRIYVLGAMFSLLATAIMASEPSPATLPPLPELLTKRGLPPPVDGEMKIDQQNSSLLSQWRKNLTPEQETYFTAAVGARGETTPRRLGAKKIPQAGTGYDWQVGARLAGLKSEDLARLEKTNC